MTEGHIAARHRLHLQLNGRAVEVDVSSGETLLEVLRRCFSLYGARESCGQGVCGTCTVLVDGRALSSCLLLAPLADGTEVETVEGLGGLDGHSVVQQTFIDEGAFQCGFCTPGMVMAATELLRQDPDPSDEAIRHHLNGNLCRCGAYPEIVRAVQAASRAIRPASDPVRGQ